MVRLLQAKKQVGFVLILTDFQSHNGAIAADAIDLSTIVADSLSIPQWCDCCKVWGQVAEFADPFQSHNGAIAALP